MLNVQVEHLENHTARITADIDPERINQAMRQVAAQLGKKARIPGFRPGKAPFNVIVTMFGFDYVLGEALDKIGNDLYREALEAAEIEPYAPGSLEEVKEGGQKIVFVVPKQPTVDLTTYRDVRVEHEPIEVTDEMVDRALEQMRQEQAQTEEVDRPAQFGDQVAFSHVEIVLLKDEDVDDEDDENDENEDDETEEKEAETSEVEESEDDDDDADDDDDNVLLFHEHNYDYVLYEDPEQEQFYPGFAAQIVGAVVGDERHFFLDLPADYEDEELAGRTLECEAHVEQVSARAVPEWSDELVKTVSNGEAETLDALRVNTHKGMTDAATSMADRDLAMQALDEIVKVAVIKYPEDLVEDYITDLVETLKQSVERQGLKLQDWLRITGQTEKDLRDQYRQAAIARAERSLVLAEVVKQEQLTVSDEDINAEIEQMTKVFGAGEQAEQFRQFFSSDYNRFNIRTDLLTNQAFKRLAAIARGENPAIGMPPVPEAAATAEVTGEPAAEETPATAETVEEKTE